MLSLLLVLLLAEELLSIEGKVQELPEAAVLADIKKSYSKLTEIPLQ